MLKPPTPPIPGMTDTLEFVKNLWGGMNVPGVGVPGMTEATLSTDQLDKKIADLKAVEVWLNMNTTMLRATIQALEVQRGTLAAIKSMSATMVQAMGQAGDTAAAAASMNPFFAAVGAGSADATGKQPQAGVGSGAQAGAQSGPSAATGAEPPPDVAGIPAAMAWWNMLQDQFTQAATSAMSSDAMANAAAMAKAATPAAPGNAQADSNTATPKGSKPGAAKD
ncbi:MAG: PhaM family polyhydroxyalkanoate granule multifunctional regulatory protein [Telluria sp.]